MSENYKKQFNEPPPTFFSTFGRLPGTWWILAISVFAGLFEGIGLTLFLPLISLMGGSSSEATGIIKSISNIFYMINQEPDVVTLLIAITVLILFGFFLGYLQRRALHKAFNDYILNLRKKILEGMLKATWPFLSKQASGEVVSNLILETSQTSTGLMMQMHMAVSAIQICILGVFSATLSWPLLLLVIGFSLLVFIFSRPVLKKSDALGKGLTVANQNFGFHSVDYMRGSYLIKATAIENSALNKLDSLSEQVYRMRLGIDLLSAMFQFFLQAMPVIVIVIVIVIAYFALGIETAGIFTFLLLMARMMPRLADIQQRYQSYLSYRPAFVVIDRMIDECKKNNERELYPGKRKVIYKKCLTFDDVTFSYPNTEAKVIEGVTLEVPKNKMVALVGGSGAGKTTIVNLIAGLYIPTSGKVLIDGIDLNTLSLNGWRQRLSYVTQEVALFNDTILNNLRLGKPNVTTDEINDVLKLTQLENYISSLPNGLHTELGENGVRLSGGQRQRLALARALIRKPDLLLLDEATSALDNETERVIQDAIDSIADRMTILLVAHRLSTVRRADHIYVMESGKLVEDGSYSSLLESKGRFFQLHEAQLQTGHLSREKPIE